MDWNDLVYYAPDCASGLRRKRPWVIGGKGNNAIRAEAGSMAGSLQPTGYWLVRVGDNEDLAHRIIWQLHFGPIPDNMQIDHEYGLLHGNIISNLRLVSQKINLRNQRKRSTNTSGVTGVSRSEQSSGAIWRATWQELDGRQNAKAFSVNKYGEGAAKIMAMQVRDEAMKRLNEQGAGYTEHHGQTESGV